LLDNALKFSKTDVPPVINVSASHEKGNEIKGSNMFIKLTFSDNGIGFGKEFNEKIFILFRRLHSNASPIPGKGIGLAICKKVMVNHNGYITAKGEEGVGASFELYFPESTVE
jgi:signal transduction histidine kinase